MTENEPSGIGSEMKQNLKQEHKARFRVSDPAFPRKLPPTPQVRSADFTGKWIACPSRFL